jgi:hypothetical protein
MEPGDHPGFKKDSSQHGKERKRIKTLHRLEGILGHKALINKWIEFAALGYHNATKEIPRSPSRLLKKPAV